MLSSSLDTLLKLSKTTYPQKLFANDCVTLYVLESPDLLPVKNHMMGNAGGYFVSSARIM